MSQHLGMEPTLEAIRAARIDADNVHDEALGQLFRVDWAKVPSDKRKGRIYAWRGTGEFLGMFTTHGRAWRAGASITRIGSIWFRWQEKR